MLSRSVDRRYNTEFILCFCGCGLTLSKYNKQGRVTKFIDGHQNRGRKYSEEHNKKLRETLKGRIFTDEWKHKISESKINEKHHMWKGDQVGNRGLHKWVQRHFPKSDTCMLCRQRPSEDLACITGIYNRELKNWAWFCSKCHCKWDNVGVRNKLK